MGSQLLAKEAFPLQEVAITKEAFKKTGISGPLNWYKAMTTNLEKADAASKFGDEFRCLVLIISQLCRSRSTKWTSPSSLEAP